MKEKWWNGRRTGTLIAAYILAIIILVGKCDAANSQCLKARLEYRGGLEVDSNSLYINTKKDHYIFKVVNNFTIANVRYYILMDTTLLDSSYHGSLSFDGVTFRLDVRYRRFSELTGNYTKYRIDESNIRSTNKSAGQNISRRRQKKRSQAKVNGA